MGWHKLLRLAHPQGIPWPFCLLYNAISRGSVFQVHYERLARDIAVFRAEGALLDIGTGPSWLLLKLSASCPALGLVGVDVSPAMVAQAQKNIAGAGASGRIEVRQGSAEQLPFPDGSFDVVVSTGSIHHWRDPVAGLDEVHRVVRPGGWALMYDIVKAMPTDVRQRAVQEFGKLRMGLLWLHSLEEPFFGQEELLSLARASRFGEGRTGFVGVLCRLAMEKQHA
jgi:ubiquinone/menaquinone biosynthesis C-methylase UbiE